eukprot:m.5212 g.5212  ORF g.5212 m.5212 type:complete len:219 (+) comp2359_c0_seq1:23-679(+)
MSSFDKAHKAGRKTHQERSQPKAREKYGLLEKTKDWKERRDDYHFKEKRLNALAEKARNRNPDEFYFGMIKSRTKDGIHKGTDNHATIYSQDEMKLLRTQDSNYFNMKLVEEGNKIDRLKSSLHMASSGKRTVFVSSKKEGMKKASDIKSNGVGRQMKKVTDEQAEAYTELAQRIKREERLLKLKNQSDLQKQLLGKGRRKKVKGKKGNFVWAKERTK